MKILKLSDEDYQALLETLKAANENAAALIFNTDYDPELEAQVEHEASEARRLLDLIKPMEYEEIKTELNRERMSMITEAVWLLNKAGIDVPMSRDGEVVHVFKAEPWNTKFLAEFEED
jgi:hypothetical protein